MALCAPELLAPAGTLRHQRYALAYGADAVYAGLPRYSLRVRNNDFNAEHLALGISEAHAQGRRFYLAANLLAHQTKLATLVADLEPLVALGPDALIVADPGVLRLARTHWPALPIHLSVQANTLNAEAVRFWADQGVSRVILSRELSIDEIAAIRDACPETELEVFVHGALCIAYSGRCLLSGYLNHRDANQGACTNACRWAYRLSAEPEATPARHPEANRAYRLEEVERPGDFMSIEEDEHGTYILNSRDLCAIEHVQRLVALGIDSLKIEGRTKSHYYVARTTQVYRRAIDDACAGRPLDPALIADLQGLANRGYTEGFYRRHTHEALQNYAEGVSREATQQFVGEILPEAGMPPGWALVEVKNRFALGDRLELLSPEGNQRFRLEAMEDGEGRALEIAPGAGWRVRIAVPRTPGAMGLLTRLL